MPPPFRSLLLLLAFVGGFGGACLNFAHGAGIPVHRFSDQPHQYWSRKPQDAFSVLLARMQVGEIVLQSGDEKAQLTSLLKLLRVPESSQILVYSATSLQSGLILPSNPRAIYFNDEVYVGFVPNGRLEIAAIDPILGPVFYLSQTTPSGRLQAQRSERCMNCHAGRTSWGVPGFVAESVIATANSGASLDGFRREVAGHTIPLSERLGGWHVTGAHEHGDHLGNLLGISQAGDYAKQANPPGIRFDWNRYPLQTSDLFAHLIFEHQIGFHNLVTLGVYRTRDALAAGGGTVRPEDASALDEISAKIVRYLLFAGEAALPNGGLKPDPVFLQAFLSRRIAGPSGISLRDPELGSRLFRYRCSYLIHSAGFVGLPMEIKSRVLSALSDALAEDGAPQEFDYLSRDEKRVIRQILRETKVL